MRLLGVLATRSEDQYARGDRVVVRTNRGLETGEVLREASENAIKQMKNPSNGQILRRMSLEDSAELERLQDQQKDYFKRSQQIVARLELKMELAEVEKLFGGERLIIYYISEDRVDFRELVKELAAEFQMRIEMRQIGVRDEAKLLADYGDCGKPVCCNTHLMQMPPVSMKMAKLQKATLDPTKISGRCGRLKCCLRYEYDTYVSLKEDLPPSGTEVITSSGRGKILNQEILSQQLLVELESGRRLMLHVSEILTTLDRKSPDYEEQVAEGERLLASVKTDEVEMALDSLTSDVNTGDLSEDDKSRRGKGKRRRRRRNSKGQKKSQQGSSESGAEDKKNTSGGPSSSGNGKKKRRRRRRRSDNKPSQNPEGGEST
jgi:cell fate regulator YaaT (PSP1 superfamily)